MQKRFSGPTPWQKIRNESDFNIHSYLYFIFACFFNDRLPLLNLYRGIQNPVKHVKKSALRKVVKKSSILDVWHSSKCVSGVRMFTGEKRTKHMNIIILALKKLYGPFLWVGFNCLKTIETVRGDSLFFTIHLQWYWSLQKQGAK